MDRLGILSDRSHLEPPGTASTYPATQRDWAEACPLAEECAVSAIEQDRQ
jgi:hypothetical protein